MSDTFARIHQEIIDDPMNADMTAKGYMQVYAAHPKARIVIVGQAPGIRAQMSMKSWNDASGDTLRSWLDIGEEVFYDPDIIALLPMDFYYPGKGNHGDLPPRKGFADTWHPRLLALMPHVQLIILVGGYSQAHYLGKHMKQNLTETVRAYHEYLPTYFPLVHTSPLNFRWQAKNTWFKETVVPELRRVVQHTLKQAD